MYIQKISFLGIGESNDEVNNVNTLYYIQNHLNSKVIGWLHTHTNGTRCMFSSVDVHSQFLFQSSLPDAIGIVLQMDSEQCKDIDFYKLNEFGMNHVNNCQHKRTKIPFHETCQNNELYKSVKNNIFIYDSPINRHIASSGEWLHCDINTILKNRTIIETLRLDISALKMTEVICNNCEQHFPIYSSKSIFMHLRSKKD